jgi:copper(I)-binding protein
VTRWNRRLLSGVVAVLVPVLAGCEAGFNAPTLEYHPANFGVDTTQEGISFANVFVLGPGPAQQLPAGGQAGTFLSLTAENGDRLVSVSAPGTATSVRIAGGAVNLPAQAPVDLSGPAPKVVLTGLTSPLDAGGTVKMDFTFARAGTITLTVPVQPRAFEYATYSPPAIPNPTASPGPSGTALPSPGASGSASPTP